MINRPHGLTVETAGTSTIDIYPSPMVYVESFEDYDNPKCAEVEDWAIRMTDRAKLRFALCKFNVTIGIHDGDNRVYAEIGIFSPNGSHSEAAEWLIERTAV